VIGPGSMPRYLPRARLALKRTLPYTRSRRRSQRRSKKEAKAAPGVNTEESLEQHLNMAFDHGPPEFPIATLRPREAGARARAALGDLQRWFVARWNWFKPRSVPCAVAGLGLLAVLASADYLANHIDQNPPQVHKILRVDIAHR
jgi:hypothetical protein